MDRPTFSPFLTYAALLWVALTGSVAVDAAVLDVTLPPYGAVGDGIHDDGPAIQAAIDAAGAGDTVFLPTGTYLLENRAPGRGLDPDNARTALLWLHSDLTIEGTGAGSVLLVGPGLNNCTPGALPRTGGFSVLQGLEKVANDDIVLRDFAIDGNAGNNPLPDPAIVGCGVDTPPGVPNFNRAGRFVTIREGSRILIENCHFFNSNSRQIVHLGDNVDPAIAFNIKILNNTFTDHDLDQIHPQGDHSSIYTVATTPSFSLASNLVSGNTFINAPGSNGSKEATALEIHGSNTRVEDNFVRNYRLGANVVASITDSSGNVFYDNDFRAVSAGFNLWSIPPFELLDTTIEANRVEQAFVTKGDNLIDWNVAFAPIRRLLIKDNTLTSSHFVIDEQNRKGAGIAIHGYTHDVSIIGNIISRTECQGILIAGPRAVPPFLQPLVDPATDAANGTSWVDGLTIQGNIIRDPGSWGKTDNACAVGVSVVSQSEPTDYKMRDIQMTSTASSINRVKYKTTVDNQDNAYAGVRLRGIIEDSTFEGIDMPSGFAPPNGGFVFDFETPSSVDFTNVVIDHHDRNTSSSPVTQKIRACPGSKWRTSAGVLWVKPLTASCDSFTDWQ